MWNIPQESDILTVMSGTELTAFRSVALQSGQIDPVAEAIVNNVNHIRGFIAACQRNILGPEGTLPDKLLKTFLGLVVMDIMSRAAGKILDQSGQRKKDWENANATLREVAICRFAVEVPDDPTTEIIANFKPSFSTMRRHRHFKLRDEDGV